MQNIKTYTIDFHGRPLTAEFSNLTEQANGSVVVKYGDTVIMATAVMSENAKSDLDYFPLTVDYEEKFYAIGKILGSRFLRRESRPSDEAVLNGRMIDRTLRPLFDGKIRNEIQIVATALSIDENNDPDIVAIFAASLALATSNIPWDGPVGAVRIGKINGEFAVNPTFEEKKNSSLDMVICGKNGKINMIEGQAEEIPENIMLEAFEKAVPEIEELVNFQNKIVKEIGKEKFWPEITERPEEMEALFEKHVYERLSEILGNPKDKKTYYTALDELKKDWLRASSEKFGEEFKGLAGELFEENIDQIVHKNVLEKNLRIDGRKLDEIRPIFTKTGILNRTHGSGLFYRGLTHILSITTLGAPSDYLLIEGMEVQEKIRFIHHYNFPPFSVGEIGRLGAPNRRSIGHGALARKALASVIPPKEEFPYTIRVVSETLSSNGSSSMGSVCGMTLSLMDAGVPIKAPVAGISVGLMMENENSYKVLTDIQGPEDHHGDTDFKVAGTEKGVTAIQMDVKVGGLTTGILKDLLAQGKKARLEILKNIANTLPAPREKVSAYAPHILILEINPDKKGALIGPGGKTINKIIDATGVQIDIEEDGKVFITGKTEEALSKAKDLVEEITYEPKVGEKFMGRVTRIFEFGAMVEVKPGIEGLVHVSEIASFRVNKVTDVLKPGDMVPVKLASVDEMGRLNFSIKQADPNFIKNASTPRKSN